MLAEDLGQYVMLTSVNANTSFLILVSCCLHPNNAYSTQQHVMSGGPSKPNPSEIVIELMKKNVVHFYKITSVIEHIRLN
jgi:hypothetical protein